VSASDGRFSFTQRVRFGDLDAMQHLNNVEFLRFFETARIEYIETIIPTHKPGEREQFGFIFAECHINYRAPGHYHDDIKTYIWPTELKRSSIKLAFEMVVEERDQTVAEGWGTLVGYDYTTGRAQLIPEEWRAKVEAELQP
jgi:acyl-CoA thioester hydrolase